ncbi:MAG: hypothetical protein AAGM22_08730 [Acidobacteriota bacterium]
MTTETPRSRFERAAWTAAGVVAGAVIGLIAGSLLGYAYVALFNVSDFEGESAFLVAYCFMLPGIPAGALGGGILAFQRSGR